MHTHEPGVEELSLCSWAEEEEEEEGRAEETGYAQACKCGGIGWAARAWVSSGNRPGDEEGES